MRSNLLFQICHVPCNLFLYFSMSRLFLSITVFITGMAVTAVELTASRLLAPYFGASLFVWTNIIGVVLLALAIGYYIGGRLADRKGGKTAKKIFYPIILITGILISIIPFVGKPVFIFAYNAIAYQNLSVFLSSLAATLVIFIIPLVLLGMVSPIAVRLSFSKLNTAGRTIGSLYAFSTIGSIIGTFLPVLVTIPLLGSRETFFLFGGILVLLGIVGTGRALLIILLAIPISLFFLPNAIHAGQNLEFEGESVYNYIRIYKDKTGSRMLLTNEGRGVQSVYNLASAFTGFYWDAATFLPALNPGGKKFLILGTAGASSARILHYFFPNLKLEGVEIDPLMVQVAKRYFAADTVGININVEDGRLFLNQTKNIYDFIMVDVYKDEMYIPFHLATKEFFETVLWRLSENGSMMMNIASIAGNSELLDLIKNTVVGVFPYVYEWTVPNSYNTLLFTFKQKPNFENISSPSSFNFQMRAFLSGIIKGIKPVIYEPSIGISLDNRSAVEFLTEKMVISEALYGYEGR